MTEIEFDLRHDSRLVDNCTRRNKGTIRTKKVREMVVLCIARDVSRPSRPSSLFLFFRANLSFVYSQLQQHAVALGEIGECPLGFLLAPLNPLSPFSLYSSTIQDFYPRSSPISPQPGCYMRRTTCGKYKIAWNMKIENKELLLANGVFRYFFFSSLTPGWKKTCRLHLQLSLQ